MLGRLPNIGNIKIRQKKMNLKQQRQQQQTRNVNNLLLNPSSSYLKYTGIFYSKQFIYILYVFVLNALRFFSNFQNIRFSFSLFFSFFFCLFFSKSLSFTRIDSTFLMWSFGDLKKLKLLQSERKYRNFFDYKEATACLN